MSYLQGLKEFLFKSNVVELAVGVVIGIAFGNVVRAFVVDFITPLIAAIGGKPNFANLSFTLNSSTFLYGDFINVFLTFLIIGLVVYSAIIYPMELTRKKTVTDKTCFECKSTIPLLATKCKFCCSVHYN